MRQTDNHGPVVIRDRVDGFIIRSALKWTEVDRVDDSVSELLDQIPERVCRLAALSMQRCQRLFTPIPQRLRRPDGIASQILVARFSETAVPNSRLQHRSLLTLAPNQQHGNAAERVRAVVHALQLRRQFIDPRRFRCENFIDNDETQPPESIVRP